MDNAKTVFSYCVIAKGDSTVMRSIIATDVLREYVRRFLIKDSSGDVAAQHNVLTPEAYEYKRLAGHAITHFMSEDIDHVLHSIQPLRGDNVVTVDEHLPLGLTFKDDAIGSGGGDNNGYNYALTYAYPSNLTVKSLNPDITFVSLRHVLRHNDVIAVRVTHGPKATERVINSIYELSLAKATNLVEEANLAIDAILERAAVNEDLLAQQTEICDRWRQTLADALIERSTLEDKIHFIKSHAVRTLMSAANSNDTMYAKSWNQSDCEPKKSMSMVNEGDRWIALLQSLQLARPTADRFMSARYRLHSRDIESGTDSELKFKLFTGPLEFSECKITCHTTVDCLLSSISNRRQVEFNFDDCVMSQLTVLDEDEYFLNGQDVRPINDREFPPDSYSKLISRIADRVPHAINMLLFKELLKARTDLIALSQRVGVAGQVMSGGFY